MKSNTLFPVTLAFAIFITGCMGSGSRSSNGFSGQLSSGFPYILESTKVILSVKRIGGNKSIKYTSEALLAKRFDKSIRAVLREKNLLTKNPKKAQARLTIKLKFIRNFVAFTNRRMQPIINYSIIAMDKNQVRAKYHSGEIYNTSKMYAKKGKDFELDAIDRVAYQIVNKIISLQGN